MLPTDSSPLRPPSTTERVSTLPKHGFEHIGSSREGWSPTRIRAGDAEYWIPQRAAEPAEDEESTTWATAYEGSEPSATDEDIREPLQKPLQVLQLLGMLRPQDLGPKLLTGISPPGTPVSERKPPMLLYSDFKVISSSRDGWSPARVRAADAEYWAFQQAARQAALEEKPAWAKDYEGPEPGATKEVIRVYTELEDGEYKYWGVRDLHETMEDFWTVNDPNNTRERVANQDSGPLPALVKFTPSKSPSPRRTASRSKRHQETPEFAKRRVTKPAMLTPLSKKSFASNVEGRDPKIDEHIQDFANSSIKEPTVATFPWGGGWPGEAERPQTISGVNGSTSHRSTTTSTARGRPPKIQWGFVDSSSSNPSNLPTSPREDPPKRKRGRPAKEKYAIKSQKSHRSYVSNEKQKRLTHESKAKVTKPKPKNERPIAPSIHKMCTRARGPAENLRRL